MANKILKNQILQVVENQMMLDEPKCVNDTFRRLIDEGYKEREAKEMIGTAVLGEIYDILKEGQEHDAARYERRLNRLGGDLQLNEEDDYAAATEEFSVEELLEQIAYNNGRLPKKQLKQIIAKRDEAIPLLLDVLRKVRENPIKYRDDSDYFLHIYAAHLLAQFRVREAYPILVDILTLPDDIPYGLFGDGIIEAGSRILASVCNSDTSLIKNLAEDANADEFMREQAIEALTILALHNLIQRDEVIEYYRKLLRDESIISKPTLLGLFINTCCDIYPEELYDDIKEKFEDCLVDELIVGIESVDEAIIIGLEETLKASEDNIHLQFIDDTIAELEDWICFDEDYKERMEAIEKARNFNIVIKEPKIGRNDPCPCGSGKKYKKCCGK
ncbi:MAG: hypothetical protein K0R84_1452 [Clostridia bacterium]|jgi:hypothetical protein|nr:hypothetical protein [Clostridia bacterium]